MEEGEAAKSGKKKKKKKKKGDIRIFQVISFIAKLGSVIRASWTEPI